MTMKKPETNQSDSMCNSFALGAEGREFKSRRPDHKKQRFSQQKSQKFKLTQLHSKAHRHTAHHIESGAPWGKSGGEFRVSSFRVIHSDSVGAL